MAPRIEPLSLRLQGLEAREFGNVTIAPGPGSGEALAGEPRWEVDGIPAE